jgi:hypothetical protein
MVIKHGFETSDGFITDSILLDVDQSVINKKRLEPYYEYMKWKLSRLNERLHYIIGSMGIKELDEDRDNKLMFIQKSIRTTAKIINENKGE